MFPTYGVPVSAVALETVSRDLFELDMALAVQDVDAGTITASSGHVGTHTRGATLASVADGVGATYTALSAQMAWEMRDLNGDGVAEAFGLRMGTADTLAFPTTLVPMAHWGYLDIIETGALATSGATLWALRNDAATGAGLWLDTSGTFYRFTYHDGTTATAVTLASGAPTSGDRVQFAWELTAAGGLTFMQSINFGAWSIATATGATLPAAWASSSSIRLNTRGASANPAQGWYRRCRLGAGALVSVDRAMERR